MFQFCPCCLEFLQGTCLLSAALDHSRSNLVSKYAVVLFSECSIRALAELCTNFQTNVIMRTKTLYGCYCFRCRSIQQKSRHLIGLNRSLLCFENSSQITKNNLASVSLHTTNGLFHLGITYRHKRNSDVMIVQNQGVCSVMILRLSQ